MKRNRDSGRRRGYGTSLSTGIFICIFFIGSQLLKGEEFFNEDVKINILSKKIKQIRNGDREKIIFSIPHNVYILNKKDGSRFYSKKIIIQVVSGRWEIHFDDKIFTAPFNLNISSHNIKKYITYKDASEKRLYPLPMTIVFSEKYPKIYVKEKLNQYILDSAFAEYGYQSIEKMEGVAALSHIILARYFYNKKNRVYKDCDFYDLTFSQVYRGKVKTKFKLNLNSYIDYNLLNENLFFSSSCGGETFSSEVFNFRESEFHGIKDSLYREGKYLCSRKEWKQKISNKIINEVFFNNIDKGKGKIKLERNKYKIVLNDGFEKKILSLENFRLKLNRLYGWNYLRSNNYSVSEVENNNFLLQGRGLGHGVGFCQKGALNLAKYGYNRFEIIKHYYPLLKFKNIEGENKPLLTYCKFNISTGKIIEFSSNKSFLNRRVPPGSFFKLIVSMYLAMERPDVFNDHKNLCTGQNTGCWSHKGHGKIDLLKALPLSCNSYFISLGNVISEKKFRSFFKKFCNELEINSYLPETKNINDFSRLLSGLKFSHSFFVKDLIKIVRLISEIETNDRRIEKYKNKISSNFRSRMFNALLDTFRFGTGVESKDEKNIRIHEGIEFSRLNRPWGKTSTVIDGTNLPKSYGMFLGGCGDVGIVSILGESNGHNTARESLELLME